MRSRPGEFQNGHLIWQPGNDELIAADLGITVAFDQLEIGFGIAIVANKSPARHAIGAVAAALDIFVG